MSDQQTTSVAEAEPVTTPTIDSEIVAEVSWTVGGRPPEVVLSFQGLAEPVGLFEELRAIGWVVPNMPPRPANAIDWTPDPVAGTDYTVLPWTVTEFRLDEGAWSVDPEHVGTRTLDALLNHGGEIEGTSDQITAHAASYAERKRTTAPAPAAATPAPAPAAEPAQVQPLAQVAGIGNPAAVAAAAAARAATPITPQSAPAAAPAPAAAAPTPDPAPAAAAPAAESETTETPVTSFRTVILLGFPADGDPLPGHGTWVGITGRKKVQCSWNEHIIAGDQPIPGHQEMGAHVANGAAAWYAETDAPLAEVAPNGYRIVRLVLPDMSVNDAKVRRLHKVLGNNLQVMQLRSLVGTNQSAVLVSATVGANSFEMLNANLCLRMPTAVVRVNP